VAAIDFDGYSAFALGLEKFGELSKTVTWTSGLPGRYQALFIVPERYRELVANKKQATGIDGEQIEFRYTGNQSVLPPSSHPITDGYRWINSPIDTPVAELPQAAIDYWLSLINEKYKKPIETFVKQADKLVENGSRRVEITAPIEAFLSKSHRHMLAGVNEGSRDNSALELARDIIGVMGIESIDIDYLKVNYRLNIAQNGAELFEMMCDNCTPPLDDDDKVRIWRSGHNGDGEASISNKLGNGAIENCARAFLKQIFGSNSNKVDVNGNNADVSDDLKRLLDRDEYNPVDSLPKDLGQLIKAESDRWSLPSIPYIAALLTVICSLAKAETVLNIRETRGKPILWVGILGTSNSGKSESMQTIIAPLTALQRGANEDYAYALADYERESIAYDKKKRGKSDEDIGNKPIQPACREYYVDDYTYESLGFVYQFQKDKGLLIKIDELKAFCDFDKYGTANNRSRMLSLYDGGEVKCNRKGSPRIHIEKTAISLVGTTQYTTLANILAADNNSEDGLWARLLFVNLPTTATYSHDPEPSNQLYTELARIYAKVNTFDVSTFTATPEAKALWTQWYNSMVDLTIANSGTFLESIYGKAKDRVARIALALHFLHAAANDKEPEPAVSKQTMHHAIGLGRLMLLETEKALALVDANPTTNPEDDRILKFVTRFENAGWVDTRTVTQWWKPISTRPNAQNTRVFMAKVVSLGYAIDNGEDIESSKYQIKISPKTGNIGNKTPVNLTESELERVARVGNKNNQANGGTESYQHVDDVANIGQQNGQHGQQPGQHKNVDTVADLLPMLPDVGNIQQQRHSEGSSDSIPDFVAKGGNTVKRIGDNGLNDFVANVARFSGNSLHIGDRARLGDDIFIINQITDEYVGGTSDDGSYVGGHPSLLKTIDIEPDKPESIPNGYTTKDAGDGFKEIISNHSATQTTIPEATEDEGY
jgi:hypothetical protein